ncbi:signal peptidase II [Elusimicrobium posterum]|uniref:signal peptidase II n=1 Tax=Elusimicrobium posterum TaxID=3116653 RepID=UPI003C75C10D
MLKNVFVKIKSWIIANKGVLAALLAITAFDRITKVITLEVLKPVYQICYAKYFCFTYVENTGMAFGLFQNANMALAVMMVIVIIFILSSWKDIVSISPKAGVISLACILGGAIGNLYDRIVLGYVVDFIDFGFWPVFNIADSFISIGAVLLGCIIILSTFKSKQKTEEK